MDVEAGTMGAEVLRRGGEALRERFRFDGGSDLEGSNLWVIGERDEAGMYTMANGRS